MDFDVVDGCRRAPEARIGGEGRLQARLALLAFEAFELGRFLAADVSAGAMVDIKVEVPAMDVVLADEPGLISLVDGGLQPLALADELAADIDVAGMRPHGEGREKSALDQQVRIVAQDFAVLAGAGLGFVAVDDEIMGPAVRLLGHERPFEAGAEAGAAAAAKPARLHLVDDPVLALFDDGLGAIPGAPRARAREPPIVEAVEVLENAVFIGKHALALAACVAAALALVNFRIGQRLGPPLGAEHCRPFCGPGFGSRPRLNASSMASKFSGVRSS